MKNKVIAFEKLTDNKDDPFYPPKGFLFKKEMLGGKIYFTSSWDRKYSGFLGKANFFLKYPDMYKPIYE